jgi:hypothetical protein
MRKGSRKKTAHTDDLLSMALIGYESAKEAIEQKISEIKKMIGSGGRAISAAVERVTAAPRKAKRRTMSAAGRKRVAAAQKKRWAAKRKADEATAKAAKSKRTPRTALAKSAAASAY